jgi:hypothetical protein
MRGGSTTSRPVSAVGGLTSVDSTLHVMTANLETLVAVSSMNMPVSLKVDQWLSGISQSKEGVVLRSNPTPTFSLTSTSSYTYSTPETWDTPPPSSTVVSEFPDVFPAHPLISFHALPPNPLTLVALCNLGPITRIISLPFTHIIQILMIGNSA